ncbi:hypothetical protein IGS68_03880 [Skermanella sp. TT6]|uniref:Uncharacterized protein n=1 Tax=Skermanella cutis TaxID=2775420 RepID=A0ABX7BAT2_9PROT|nr:hypothetical protein [Skermanella sp. TT6]QQP90408.1 hypothetical protein IGS68_03880 [Skermanella sp. TT6]
MTDISVNRLAQLAAANGSPEAEWSEVTLTQRIALECDAMARHALSTGLAIPEPLMQRLDTIETAATVGGVPAATLAALHAQLAKVVAPASPRTIYLLQIDRARNSFMSCLGPLPAIRRLVAGTALFTLMFVLTSLSDAVSVKNLASDIYSMSGLDSLLVLAFLMSAAAMGGCFHALFTAHSYIGAGTYDPHFESSYWIRIGLGVIAGLVLSQMIPIGPEVDQTTGAITSGSAAATFSKPLLALLGGFSATLVYTILQRLVDTVESLFRQKADAATAPVRGTAPAGSDIAPAAPAPAPAADGAPGNLATSAAAVAAVAAATTAAAAAMMPAAAEPEAASPADAQTADAQTADAQPPQPAEPSAAPDAADAERKSA